MIATQWLRKSFGKKPWQGGKIIIMIILNLNCNVNEIILIVHQIPSATWHFTNNINLIAKH